MAELGLQIFLLKFMWRVFQQMDDRSYNVYHKREMLVFFKFDITNDKK